MEPLLFVVAILGCGDGDSPCDELRIAPGRYQDRAACVRATAAILARHPAVDYPVIVAQCRPAAGEAPALRGSEVQLPEPEPNPHFRID